MQTVIETPSYLRAAKDAGMTDLEMSAVVDLIAGNPSTGDPIPNTGGFRKVRVAKRGGGKRGGFRVITFFSGQEIPVFLITVFGKNEKANLTRAEQNALRALSKDLVGKYRTELY